MRIRSEVGGWSTQIYRLRLRTAHGAPRRGKPIGDEPDMQTDAEIELSPRTAKYYLIWITKLASNRRTGYNVQINEVGLNS